jgi:hypothetical protein
MRDETERFDLAAAMTPKAVVERLAKQGVIISERTLREKARRIGACRIIGKTMFLMPADVEAIIEAARVPPRGIHSAVHAPGFIGQSVDVDALRAKIMEKSRSYGKQQRAKRTT